MYLFGEADKLFYFFLIQTSFISIQACTPTNIIVENITKNSSIILWDMPYQGNSTLCWEYWNGYYHHSQCQTVPAPRSYYKLTGLVPDAHYQVSINSSCGYGSYGSETTLFTTLPVRTVPTVPGIQVSAQTDETITVYRSSGCNSSEILTYVFQYKETTSEVWKGIETSDSSITIPSLKAATTYNIRAYCYNSVGKSPISSTISSLTNRGTIPSKTVLHAIDSETTPSSITVSWSPPGGGQVEEYTLTLRHRDDNLRTISLSRNSHKYKFNGLRSSTNYSIDIVATNRWGSGSLTTVEASTSKTPIGKIQNLDENVTESSILIEWKLDGTAVGCNITLAHSTGQIRQINLTGDILEHTFYGLQSGVQYNISVTPWNSDQTGEMEYIVAVTDSITTSTADNTVGLKIGLALVSIAAAVILLVGILLVIVRYRHLLCKCPKGNLFKSDSITSDDKGKEINVKMEGETPYVNIQTMKSDGNSLNSSCFSDDEEEEEETHNELNSAMAPQLPPRKYIEESSINKWTISSEPMYPDDESFRQYSGWFDPNLSTVLKTKIAESGTKLISLRELKCGIILMSHKKKENIKFVKGTGNLYKFLHHHFKCLYRRELDKLTSLGVELKYFSPNAEDWSIKVWQYDSVDRITMETNKKIMEYRCLRPHGMISKLTFSSKEEWTDFVKWYRDYILNDSSRQSQSKKKRNKPF